MKRIGIQETNVETGSLTQKVILTKKDKFW